VDELFVDLAQVLPRDAAPVQREDLGEDVLDGEAGKLHGFLTGAGLLQRPQDEKLLVWTT